MENVFRRLETCVNIPMNAGMMNAIVNVLTEVICILAIATKEINQNRASESIFDARLTRLVYLSTETFLKKLVGRKDIEDAIQRLENVAAEEARMAAVEALNGFHGIGDKVMGFEHKNGIQSAPKALEGGMKGVRETLQGTDARARNTRNKAINGASTISDWSRPSLSMPIPLGVAKQGRQMATDFHAVFAGGSKAVHGVSLAEESNGTWNRARIPNGTSAMRNFVTRTVDGKQVILSINHPHHTECPVC
jgi:hypothetical protein